MSNRSARLRTKTAKGANHASATAEAAEAAANRRQIYQEKLKAMSGEELGNLITDRGGQDPAPAPRRRKSADSAESVAKRKKNIEAKDGFIFATCNDTADEEFKEMVQSVIFNFNGLAQRTQTSYMEQMVEVRSLHKAHPDKFAVYKKTGFPDRIMSAANHIKALGYGDPGDDSKSLPDCFSCRDKKTRAVQLGTSSKKLKSSSLEVPHAAMLQQWHQEEASWNGCNIDDQGTVIKTNDCSAVRKHKTTVEKAMKAGAEAAETEKDVGSYNEAIPPRVIKNLVDRARSLQDVKKGSSGIEHGTEWKKKCGNANRFLADLSIGNEIGARGGSMRALEKTDFFARRVEEAVGLGLTNTFETVGLSLKLKVLANQGIG